MNDLEYIDLQMSFVMDWRVERGNLIFEIEACLTSKHPYYSAPKANEAECWIQGKLEFESPTDIKGLKDKEDVPSTIDPDGSQDFGEIEELRAITAEQWLISGEFGEVLISDSILRIHLENTTAEQGAAGNPLPVE